MISNNWEERVGWLWHLQTAPAAQSHPWILWQTLSLDILTASWRGTLPSLLCITFAFQLTTKFTVKLLAAWQKNPGDKSKHELIPRCRRQRILSFIFHQHLSLVAEGPHCAVPEVIATTKQGQTICLSPSAPWVKLILTRILKRYHCQRN
uniref:Chemokine interleukin-8-like domain-containing protein n=1 Tax=Calidris pygmaea TaxID=425635 RepID=A0A8C3J6A0_9CHAR